jgi:hypothetical protein
MRRIGIAVFNDSITFAGTAAVISVSISPGVTALTVIPMASAERLSALASANAASRASVFVNPNRPDFVVGLADVADLARDRRDIDDAP